jgi:putative transposase
MGDRGKTATMGGKFNPDFHHRRSVRLKEYDYTQAGAYFVTICTRGKECLLGEIADGEVRLNPSGEIVAECWNDLPRHFQNVAVDEFVVMPNHVHGILIIVDDRRGRGKACLAPTIPPVGQFGRPIPGSLPTIVGSFKSASTRRINESRGTPGATIWQRGYYELIVWNEKELNPVRQYIAGNPLKWASDPENLANPHGRDRRPSRTQGRS